MLVIGPAKQDELESLLRLAARSVGTIDAEHLANEMERDAVIVAREARTDTVIGFAVMRRDPGCEGQLLALAVDRFHRSQGVGSALLREVEDQLVGSGAKRLHLEVRSDNLRAQDFYYRHGFHPEGLHGHAYPDGEDAVRLARPL